MGGAAGEVQPRRRAIVLEAANFNGARVRRMSNALGLRTEASSRHEKSLAPALTDIGAARAAQLLCELGATAVPPHAFGAAIASSPPIALTRSRSRTAAGTRDGTASASRAHLSALGCGVTGPVGTDALGHAAAVAPRS